MSSEPRLHHGTALKHRPFIVDVLEWMLHQACFLWWKITGQMM